MSFKLEYGAESVTLRNPDLRESYKLDTRLLVTRLRSMDVKVIRDSDWVDKEVYTYEFKALTQSDVTDLKSFLISTAGLEIKITDHLSDEYYGHILTSEIEFITVKDDCTYDVSFEFCITDDPVTPSYDLLTEVSEGLNTELSEQLVQEDA